MPRSFSISNTLVGSFAHVDEGEPILGEVESGGEVPTKLLTPGDSPPVNTPAPDIISIDSLKLETEDCRLCRDGLLACEGIVPEGVGVPNWTEMGRLAASGEGVGAVTEASSCCTSVLKKDALDP